MTLAREKETQKTELFYPTSDGEPVAETYDHLYAILIILEVLRQYLKGRQATVLGNQFLYYLEGEPEKRTAPDIMVIFDVAPGGRDSYKIWEEGSTPKVVFEITSPSTKNEDKKRKKDLYQEMGIEEYWLFDPKGQWIKSQLLGYRLKNGVYQEIKDNRSEPLKLELKVEGKLIGFYREDTGEKLLIPDELAENLKLRTEELQVETKAREEAEKEVLEERQLVLEERQRAQEERQRALELEELLARYRDRFGDLPDN